MQNQTNGHATTTEALPIEDSSQLEAEFTVSLDSTPPETSPKGGSIGFLLVIFGAISLPSLLRPAWIPPAAPAVTPGQSSPVAVDPITPSDTDISRSLNEAIASAQSGWDDYVNIRADQFIKNARATDNTPRSLLAQCTAITRQYQQATWQRGSFESGPGDATTVRSLHGDSFACLVAIRRIVQGQSTTGKSIQPQSFLNKSRFTLGQYAAQLGVEINAISPQQASPSHNQPATHPNGQPINQPDKRSAQSDWGGARP